MPTPTDLVTDLPADFEVFGQAVDTDFADLLGGANGYILSKASATDLDFAWIPNDQGDITAVNVTAPITGGGSAGAVTIGVSAASTSASGVVQLSDSTSTTSSVLASTPTATKSAYDLAASAYAPAFTNNFYAGKNKIINGDFGINQRAFTSTSSSSYGFDRWTLSLSGGTATYSSETFTVGSAPVAGYEAKNFAKVVATVGNDYCKLDQRIESVRTLAGQTVTVSFWAKGTNPATLGSLNVTMVQSFGSGGSPSASVIQNFGSFVLTANWTRYTLTGTVPSISGKTIGTANDDNIGFGFGQGANASAEAWTLDIWGVQVEAGSVATPFQIASGSIAGELALCQRYFQYLSGSGNTYIGTGYARTTTRFDCFVPLMNTMRSTPSVTATGQLVFETGASGTITSSSVNLAEAMKTGIALYMVCTGATNGFGGLIYFSTSSSLSISAEL